MAVAIVCASVLAQAATVSWTATSITKDGTAVSGLAYLINDAKFSRAEALALAGTGAQNFIDTLSSSSAMAQAWKVTDGKAETFSTSTRIENSALGAADNTAVNFYAIVFNTDTITNDSYFYVTAIKSVQTASGTSNKVIGLGNQSVTSAAEGAWQAVPEPTTGLLLLLGVAGLALRRKQA